MIASFNAANMAARYQMMRSDLDQSRTIYTQMAADAQKENAKRWKILSDTQTKIFEIVSDVTVNKAKTHDKLFDQWDKYIRS